MVVKYMPELTTFLNSIKKENKKHVGPLNLKKISAIVVCSLLLTTLVIGLSPSSLEMSDDLCNQCHDSHYQYIDLREKDISNQIPTTINVGETKTISVLVENIVDAGEYTELYDVIVTLSSRIGHFLVSSPVYRIDQMSEGIATATWEITGVSAGVDSIGIRAEGTNLAHIGYVFVLVDNYFPSPSITVELPSDSTSEPTQEPTPPPTQEPTSEPTPEPTPEPTTEPTPEPTQEPSSEPTPEPTPEPNPTPQEPEPESSEPNSTQPTKTSSTITTEVLIAASVAIASILAAVGFWAIKRR
jgi:hypothetical protein